MQSVTLQQVTIRAAILPDAERLAALAEQTFRDTYAAENSPANLALHLARNYGLAHQSRELADRTMTTLVAEHDATLIGYAQLLQHPAPGAVTGPHPIEILRFYVDRAWKGLGVGRLLMAELKAEARRLGAGSAWLGVWQRNLRAIAFYEKCGFVTVGETVYVVGEDRQSDLVMQCILEQ